MGPDENLGELSMSVLCLLSETSQSQASSQFCQNCLEPSHGQLHGSSLICQLGSLWAEDPQTWLEHLSR